MAIVVTTDLERKHRRGAHVVHALCSVDLRIEPGEFTALTGPPGSGKTTLLHLIGGLDTPSAGQVRLVGQDLAAMGRADRSRFCTEHLGFVFQAYNLIPVLSAYQNAGLTLSLQGCPAAEGGERAMRALKDVGLEGMEHRCPTELSGGQRRRVALARALAGEPALVLADEPTANLDTATGYALLDTMREFNQRQGVTFLFATHDPKVMERASRVVRLVDGRVDEDLRK